MRWTIGDLVNRKAIVRALAVACGDLADIVVEDVETIAEYMWFCDERFRWFRGYLFARPAFERFPEVNYPEF
jgi:blue light- and temperature-responsive anti-repressor